MKVLYLITSCSLADGIARHVVSLCHYFCNIEGVNVAVCITHEYGDLSEKLESMGVKVYNLNCRHGHELSLLRRFHRVIREYRPSVVHSHIMAFNIRVYLSLFARNLPVVSTLHMFPPVNQGYCQRFKKVMASVFNLNLQRVLTVSPDVREACRGLSFYEKTDVVYNPVVLNNQPDCVDGWLKMDLCLPKNAKVIGFIGRLAAVKDLQSFLQMAGILVSESEQYHFVVVGNGPDESLKNSEVAKQYDSNIHWLGYRTDAINIMKELDLFVLTSVKEAMPTVLLEAFMLRTPVVAFVSPGGVSEIVKLERDYEGGVGGFIAERDVNCLADAARDVLSNNRASKIRVENAYQLVRDKFDVSVVGRKILDVYNSVVANH